MNVRVGFQRVYAVLTVTWFGLVLLTIPTEKLKFWIAEPSSSSERMLPELRVVDSKPLPDANQSSPPEQPRVARTYTDADIQALDTQAQGNVATLTPDSYEASLKRAEGKNAPKADGKP